MDDLKAVLTHASSLVDQGATTPEVAAGMVSKHIQVSLAASRTTLWALQVDDGERVLKRIGGFDGVAQEMLLAPMVLRESELAPLFELLVSDSIYACDDTDADSRLNPLRLAHLLPDDIRASITAPVSINGHVVGIVSCTQRGTTSRWTQREVAAMRRIADEIALRHIRRRRVLAEASLLADGPADPATWFSGAGSGAPMPREETRSGDSSGLGRGRK